MSIQSVREAQESVAAAVAQDPAKARSKNPSATAALQQDLRFHVTGPAGEAADTDMPRKVGGAAAAPTPSWLMRAALASCTGTVIALRAAQRGVTLKTLEVTVESESDMRGMLGLDERVSPGLSGLSLRVRIGAENAAPRELRELVEWGGIHRSAARCARHKPRASISRSSDG